MNGRLRKLQKARQENLFVAGIHRGVAKESHPWKWYTNAAQV